MPIKGDLAGSGVIQADDAAADGGLAGTGLAHQTIGLAGIDFKADIVHSLDGIALAHAEILLQALDLQQRSSILSCHYSASLIFSASARMRAMR